MDEWNKLRREREKKQLWRAPFVALLCLWLVSSFRSTKIDPNQFEPSLSVRELRWWGFKQKHYTMQFRREDEDFADWMIQSKKGDWVRWFDDSWDVAPVD